MARLTDIKETDFGIDNVLSYRIERAIGSAGETFEIQVAGWVDEYAPGDYVTIKGISGFITQREYTATTAGYLTVLRGVSVVADVMRRAPEKALIFMSMTSSEHDDFVIANEESGGGTDYSKLDYIPLIRICDSKTLIGGWNSQQVVQQLSSMMGLSVVYNVVVYWLKQVRADIQSSFFDTIMSIIGFMEPIVYVQDGVLYILNNPVKNGTVDLRNITQFSQRETFNFSSKMSLIQVNGGLGQWDQSMEKGIVGAEKTATLEYESVRESAEVMAVHLKGDIETIKRQVGGGETTEPGKGGLDFTVEMRQPKEDRDKRTEIVLLDPWGNVKAQLSTSEMKSFISPVDNTEHPVFQSTTEYEYDFLDEMFERPREKRHIQTITEWTWEIAMFPGYPYRKYKTKTKIIEKARVYGPNGILICELETHKADVLRLSTDQAGLYAGMITYIELAVADMLWVADSEIVQIVTNETEIRYRQVTPNMYEKAIFRRRNAGLRRKQGDELRSHETLMVMGRVPRHPAKYRRSQVYAELSVGSDTSPPASIGEMTGEGMEVPALVVSNPNIISWRDAGLIANELRRKVSDKKMNIERTYVFAGDLDVDIGWGAVFGEVFAFSGKANAVEASEVSIVGWSKTKDAPGATVTTTITIEGKQTASGGGGGQLI